MEKERRRESQEEEEEEEFLKEGKPNSSLLLLPLPLPPVTPLNLQDPKGWPPRCCRGEREGLAGKSSEGGKRERRRNEGRKERDEKM